MNRREIERRVQALERRASADPDLTDIGLVVAVNSQTATMSHAHRYAELLRDEVEWGIVLYAAARAAAVAAGHQVRRPVFWPSELAVALVATPPGVPVDEDLRRSLDENIFDLPDPPAQATVPLPHKFALSMRIGAYVYRAALQDRSASALRTHVHAPDFLEPADDPAEVTQAEQCRAAFLARSLPASLIIDPTYETCRDRDHRLAEQEIPWEDNEPFDLEEEDEPDDNNDPGIFWAADESRPPRAGSPLHKWSTDQLHKVDVRVETNPEVLAAAFNCGHISGPQP